MDTGKANEDEEIHQWTLAKSQTTSTGIAVTFSALLP